MLKNITLSAEESLIRNAREKAAGQHTTVNSQFRIWLKEYTSDQGAKNKYRQLMESLDYASTSRSFSRDDMNER